MVKIEGVNLGDLVVMKYRPLGNSDKELSEVVGFVYSFDTLYIRLANWHPESKSPWNSNRVEYSSDRVMEYEVLSRRKKPTGLIEETGAVLLEPVSSIKPR